MNLTGEKIGGRAFQVRSVLEEVKDFHKEMMNTLTRMTTNPASLSICLQDTPRARA